MIERGHVLAALEEYWKLELRALSMLDTYLSMYLGNAGHPEIEAAAWSLIMESADDALRWSRAADRIRREHGMVA